MSSKIYELSDGSSTNTLLEFISTYFPFIDEPIKLIYRGRTYKVLTTQIKKIEFEDFFISHNCLKCAENCCKNMYIPIGFEDYWPSEKLEVIRRFKPHRYPVIINDQKMNYYIGFVGYKCKFQNGKSCGLWDSRDPVQKRPMGCHFYPMTWYWDEEENMIIFTKYCYPYLCKAESTRYIEQDYERDLNTFEKICKEIEGVGFSVNYAPLDALKEQHYFSI